MTERPAAMTKDTIRRKSQTHHRHNLQEGPTLTQFARPVNTERNHRKQSNLSMKFLRNMSKRQSKENPSVLDYPDKAALETALGGSSSRPHAKASLSTGSTHSSTPSSSSRSSPSSSPSGKQTSIEWKLQNGDRHVTTPRTMEEEVERLLVLQSYFVLDTDREEAFDRITGIASRVFDAPIALLSLVDLGREWFLSNHGMGDVRETPRKDSFCAHIVESKHNNIIVPDTTKDTRFNDNPLVVGAPHFRFYAGVPLISPEGQRLGSLCIISPNARPAGLTDSEQETLHDLSLMAMNAMVDRRSKLQNNDRENTLLLQQTCTDVTASLDSIQQTLVSLCADPAMRQNFTKKHLKTYFMLVEASESMGINADMCRSTLKQIAKHDQPSKAKSGNDSNTLLDLLDQIDGIMDPVVDMEKLFKNLRVILDPLPKKVPITIVVDPAIPATITGDDLMLFRATLSLLTNAVSRAGSESGNIHLSLTPRGNALHFECRDSGLEIPSGDQENLFIGKDTDSSRLTSFAATVSFMDDSDYGYRYETDNTSVFWFSVPFSMAEGTSGKVTTETLTLDAKLPSAQQASEMANSV
jgi:hypothetical protein